MKQNWHSIQLEKSGKKVDEPVEKEGKAGASDESFEDWWWGGRQGEDKEGGKTGMVSTNHGKRFWVRGTVEKKEVWVKLSEQGDVKH